MRIHVILRYTGIVLLFNSAFLLISSIISFTNSDSAFFPLLYSFIITTIFGIFPLIFVPPITDITNKEGFVIVISSWLISCLFGTMPYIQWGGDFTFTNAWFESVSGYTTTGSSILNNIEALPMGLLFWRASTHWIGGIGILIFVLSVMPYMGKAGMVLYRTEMSPLARENFRYRTKRTIMILVYVYTGLTFLETISLWALGMPLFDAITNSFATIATGGFCVRNTSIAFYRSPAIEIVIIIFMILSGMHFGLLFEAVKGRPIEIWRSSVIRYYLVVIFIGVILVAINIHGSVYPSWKDSLRYSAFQIISIGTSTGFATSDSSIWPSFSQLILIFFTLQCACAGSTSGGIKTDRVVILWKAIKKGFDKIKHPSAVITVKLNRMPIDDDVLESSILYISFYIIIVFISALILTALGVDAMSAFSGSAATMGNVGPGLGMVGSMSNFSSIPDAGKWVLSITMLLGRLEIFGLILFFLIKTWK